MRRRRIVRVRKLIKGERMRKGKRYRITSVTSNRFFYGDLVARFDAGGSNWALFKEVK